MTEHTYRDPVGMPTDERMTDAELRVVREHLGLPQDWLAAHLGVTERTMRRWEAGTHDIPDGVRAEIERLEQVTADVVDGLVETLMDQRVEDPILTYRSDADYRQDHPEVDWPASWHRRVLARVADEVPGLSIVYAPAVETRPFRVSGAG